MVDGLVGAVEYDEQRLCEITRAGANAVALPQASERADR